MLGHDHDLIGFGLSGFRNSKGKSMSAFERDDTAVAGSAVSTLTINDRLIMMDIAYARQDRAACAYFIEDFYAQFDAAEASYTSAR